MSTKKLQLTIFVLLCGATGVHAQSYNVISGTVWKETLPVNNIMDSGEDRVAGTLVSLKNVSTNEIVSSAVSGSDGVFYLDNYVGPGTYYLQYDFPATGYTLVAKRVGGNNTINSAADPSTNMSDPVTIATNTTFSEFNLGVIAKPNTLTYCADKNFDLTIWNDTFSLPQFINTTNDSLIKATLFVADAAWHPYIGVENTGSQNTTADFGFSGRLAITPPGATNIVTNTTLNEEVSLAGFDGSLDYDGTSGYSWYDLYSSALNSRVMNTAPQLAPYIGSGLINFPAQAKSTTSFSGGGNLETNVETQIASGLCITYEYLHSAPLPVSLKNISASTDGTHSFIKWATASEYQNKGFAIERSNDGKNFNEIGFVNSLADNGTSTTDLKYDFTDEHPVANTNYYRLKQIDLDGKVVYSKTLPVNILNENEAKVFPNPARNFITVNAAKEDKVILFDLAGKILNVQITDMGAQKNINVNDLPNGNYYLKLTTANGIKTSRFSVLR